MHRLQNAGRSSGAPNRLNVSAAKTPTALPAIKRVGRFAPTPSGDLHIGSLVAAVASAADIKRHGGDHRIRIDDIDPPRLVEGSIDRICQVLPQFGIPIDGEIFRQSDSITRYQQALVELVERDAVFACTCSRKVLKANNVCAADCRNTRLTTNRPIDEQLQQFLGRAAVRLDTDSLTDLDGLAVHDEIQSLQSIDDITTLGTPVVWRKDGYVSYMLATAIDDSDDITDVVRGADLWPESAHQQLIMECLKRRVPRWMHVPCAVDHQNNKLGKQTRAPSIHNADPLTLLQKVWRFLGQPTPVCGSLEDFWAHAAATWSLESVPRASAQRID